MGQVTNRVAGLWSDPNTWVGYQIPADSAIVYLTHDITVDVNTICKNFNANEFNVTINPGVSFSITGQREKDTVMDTDGNVYKTIGIGSQVWMAENLKTTHYNDGTALPNISDDHEWAGLTTGAYCNYNNDSSNVPAYGRLYNWFAAADTVKRLCPKGWHLPTIDEWNLLFDYLGGPIIAGRRIREAGFDHWIFYEYSYPDSNNFSGFSARAAGYRDNLSFGNLGHFAVFWSGTPEWKFDIESPTAMAPHLFDQFAQIDNFAKDKAVGLSCRCIKD